MKLTVKCYTAQDRIRTQVLNVLIQELSSWTMETEEMLEYEEILRRYIKAVPFGYEAERESLRPCIQALLEKWGNEIGL